MKTKLDTTGSGGRARKHPLNKEFFNSWSHDMAYILGFISADGSVSNNGCLEIKVHKKDISVLKYIRRCISPTSLIKKDMRHEHYRLRISSVDLVASLKPYGIIPNKTFSIAINFDIPKQFIGDYIRGVFDGDGWVYTRRNSIDGGICSASKKFIYGLKALVENIGYIRQQKHDDKRAILYSWCFDHKMAIRLRDIMYASEGFSLKRKRNIFFSNFYIPSPRLWTNDQIQYLKKYYIPNQSPQIIADAIGKSYKSVSKKIWELDLNKK